MPRSLLTFTDCWINNCPVVLTGDTLYVCVSGRASTSRRPLIVWVVNQCSTVLQLAGSVTCGIVFGMEPPCLSAGRAGAQGDPSQGQWACFSPDGLSRVLQDSRKNRKRERDRQGERKREKGI